jgi:putative effector of murein hydrolase
VVVSASLVGDLVVLVDVSCSEASSSSLVVLLVLLLSTAICLSVALWAKRSKLSRMHSRVLVSNCVRKVKKVEVNLFSGEHLKQLNNAFSRHMKRQ